MRIETLTVILHTGDATINAVVFQQFSTEDLPCTQRNNSYFKSYCVIGAHLLYLVVVLCQLHSFAYAEIFL